MLFLILLVFGVAVELGRLRLAADNHNPPFFISVMRVPEDRVKLALMSLARLSQPLLSPYSVEDSHMNRLLAVVGFYHQRRYGVRTIQLDWSGRVDIILRPVGSGVDKENLVASLIHAVMPDVDQVGTAIAFEAPIVLRCHRHTDFLGDVSDELLRYWFQVCQSCHVFF
ncbi:hypothetical protein ABW54_24750 [Burkholderia cenocepacia]|nr:hypothetical protein ABW54_24750 [Burkholderia cenocepacia]